LHAFAQFSPSSFSNRFQGYGFMIAFVKTDTKKKK